MDVDNKLAVYQFETVKDALKESEGNYRGARLSKVKP